MSSPSDESPAEHQLPLKEIPGGYGLPFLGALIDRYDYFYVKGQDEFFKAKIAKYDSTVFRTNMPPGHFVAADPRVVAVLDAASFSVLLDNSKVEKRNVLDGTFMPSVSFTGGHRVCAYLDTAEPQHAKLKSFFLSAVASRKDRFIPLFRSSLSRLFDTLEDKLSASPSALVDFNKLNDEASFDFIFRLFSDEKTPSEADLGTKGSAMVDKWLVCQLAPLITLGLSVFVSVFEDCLFRTLPLPWLLVKSDYQKLYDAFYSSSTAVLDEAVRSGIDRKEACHNLVFLAGFNAYGGFKGWFPTLMKWIAAAGEGTHRRLAEEIRAAVKEHGGVNFMSLESMPLTKSVVYEALRIEPPVPYQYGKAREDMVVQSHVARFKVKKGEMIFGYMPFATKDPKVFDAAEEFVGDRFVGESGARLLKHVLWSNGRETENPTAENKQCPGKDLVVLMSRVLVVEFFLRYDSFSVEAGKLLLGSSVKFRSVTKAT